MSSSAHLVIHRSQFPDRVRCDLLDSLRSRKVNHKFHYDSFKQGQRWLALHESFSPARRDPDCQTIYERCFERADFKKGANPPEVFSLFTVIASNTTGFETFERLLFRDHSAIQLRIHGHDGSTIGEQAGRAGVRQLQNYVDRLRLPHGRCHETCALSVEERGTGEAGADYRKLRRGWCLGDKAFRQDLLEQMQERLGAEHYGEEWAETLEEHTEEIVTQELKRRRWSEKELERRLKGDKSKVAMAVRGASRR